MTQAVVTLRLNQQQLELIDNSVRDGRAPGREDLIRLALREFAAAQAGAAGLPALPVAPAAGGPAGPRGG